MAARRRLRLDDDSGFTLLEMIISIVLVTVVMAALTVLYVNVLGSVTAQRAKQAATSVATDAVDNARSIGAAGAVHGRDASSVATQFGSFTTGPVADVLTQMTPASDTSASPGSGRTAALPTVAQQRTINGLTYSVNYLVGYCYRAGSDSTDTADCVRSQASGSVQYTRVVVAVGWSNKSCAGGSCTYVSSVLLNGSAEPLFNFNTTPPPAPKLSGCLNQTSAVGDDLDLPVVKSQSSDTAWVCTLSNGVPNFTWSAVGLPAGMDLSQNGHVVGTGPDGVVGAAPGTYTVTITVQDAFLRASTGNSFTWTVLPQLLVSPVADRIGVVGTAVPTVALTATGGTGSGYTWTASGLPTGLGVSKTGQITGTPTAAGTFHPTVTVTDGSGSRSASLAFTWTIYPVLVATAPPDQAGTVDVAITPVPLTVTGGSGTYTVTDPGHSLPHGVSVTSRAGGGYQLVGTPDQTVTGTVSLLVTDATSGQSATMTFKWTVYPPPSITQIADQKTHVDGSIDLAVQSTCPDGHCTFSATIPAGVGWLHVNPTTGEITGTAPDSPVVLEGLTVTVTSADGVRATTPSFTWTISDGPVITDPGDQMGHIGDSTNLLVTAVCGRYPGCTWSPVTGLPPTTNWTPTNGATPTGTVTGTLNSRGSFGPIVLSITDSHTPAQSDTASITWNVYNWPTITSPGSQTWTVGAAIPDSGTPGAGLQLASTCDWQPCTYTIVSGALPNGVSLNASTGSISGSPSTTGSGSVTISITDGSGIPTPGGSGRASFSWTARSALQLSMPSTLLGSLGESPAAPGTIDLSAYTHNALGTVTYTATSSTPGISLNVAGSVLTGDGTPGGYPVTVTATDSSGVPQQAQFTWYLVKFDIPDQVTAPNTRSRGSCATSRGTSIHLPDYFLGDTATTVQFTATGLPSGASLSGQNLTLTSPCATGTWSITVTAKDPRDPSVLVSSTFSWTVTNLSVDTVDQNNHVGDSVNINVSNWIDNSLGTVTVTADNLPSGVSLAKSGGTYRISGKLSARTVPGATVTLTVTDSTASISATFTWTVYAGLVNNGAPNQSSPTSTTITPVQVSTNCEWLACQYSAGNLPPGLSINASTGVISGTTRSTSGTYNVSVTVRDGGGSSVTSYFTWTVYRTLSLSIPNQSDTKWQPAALDLTDSTTGGAPGYSYRLTSGTLPPGLTLDTDSGMISGIPTATGTWQGIKITVTDSQGNTDDDSFDWTIGALQGQLKNQNKNNCLRSNTSNALSLTTCNGNNDREWTFDANGTLHLTSSATRCLQSGNSNGSAATMVNCNAGNSSQQWTYTSDGTIRSGSGYVLARGNNNNSIVVQTAPTSPSSSQTWTVS